MILGKEILCLIPARGGSKGVERKNVRLLGGQPLIGWTIQAALKSQFIDRVVVSTEDREIAAVAAEYGANVPFVRPERFATDRATAVDVVVHALGQLPGPELLVLLQPTSPFRTAADIDGALEVSSREKTSVASVCLSPKPPHWMYRLADNRRLTPLIEDSESVKRRQQSPEIYVLNGAVYVIGCAALMSTRKFIDEGTVGYPMPPERSLDIDTDLDWLVAEAMMAALR